MRGPDALPSWAIYDEEPASAPILAVSCPCCKGLDEAYGPRVCLSYIAMMTRELGAFLGPAPPPFHGVTGWANLGEGVVEMVANGCLRCGGGGVVSVDAETEEML